MVDVPAEVLWGQVTGYFTQALADTDDVGNAPDAIPMNGTITLVPSPNYVKFPTTTPPQMVTLRPIELTLVNGYLKAADAANPDEVFILASSQPNGSPDHIVWTVQFNLEGLSSNEQPANMVIEVPAGGVVNIVTAMPASPDPGIAYVLAAPDAYWKRAILTQAAYDALPVKDTGTLYVITG